MIHLQMVSKIKTMHPKSSNTVLLPAVEVIWKCLAEEPLNWLYKIEMFKNYKDKNMIFAWNLFEKTTLMQIQKNDYIVYKLSNTYALLSNYGRKKY